MAIFEPSEHSLKMEDPAVFQNNTRVTPQLFDEALEKLAPAIEKLALVSGLRCLLDWNWR